MTPRSTRTAAAFAAVVCGMGVLTAAAAPASAAPAPYSPKQVQDFLVGFYGQHGPSDAARASRVTPELRKKAERTTSYDLLLCAQNLPKSIQVGKVTTDQATRRGRATVTTSWASGPKQHFAAYVGLDASKPLRLADVVCRTK